MLAWEKAILADEIRVKTLLSLYDSKEVDDEDGLDNDY